MRTTPNAATALSALTAALLLTACGGGGGGGEGNGGAKAEAKGPAACRIGDVGIDVGPANAAPAAGDTGNVPVNVTNQGRPCTLDGLPAVRLSSGGESVEVPAQRGAKAQPLELAEEQTVSFTVTYVRGEAGAAGGFDAEELEVALPGGSDGTGFPWSYGPLAGTSADDISVSAFQQAGD